MSHTIKSIALAALLVPGAALAQIDLGAQIGTTDAAITEYFTAQGYVVEEIEREEDEIEVMLTLDGVLSEAELNANGILTEIELADADDDEDDDGDEDDDDNDDDDA